MSHQMSHTKRKEGNSRPNIIATAKLRFKEQIMQGGNAKIN